MNATSSVPRSTNSVRRAALNWARVKGYHVFPYDHEAGKGHIPYRKGSPDLQATTNLKAIADWWNRWPDAGITADLKKSHYLAVDVDGKNGKPGYQSLEKWESEHGSLPRETEHHKSRSGQGEHLTYVIPEKYREHAFSNKISPEGFPGLDFVFNTLHLPASPDAILHDSQPVEAPEHLMEWLVSSSKPSRPSTPEIEPPTGYESLSVERRAFCDTETDTIIRCEIAELKKKLEEPSWNTPCYNFACRIYELAYRYPESYLDAEQAERLISENWPPADEGNWNEANVEKTRQSALKTIQDKVSAEGYLYFKPGEMDFKSPDSSSSQDEKTRDDKPKRETSSRIVYFAEVEAKPLEYYEEPWLPLVGLTGLAGPEDTGKSTFFIHEMARLTTGGYGRPPIKVLYLAKEDNESMIKARLKLAGADLSRVGVIRITEQLDEQDSYERDVNLKHELEVLRRHLKEDPEFKALYLDPASSFLGIEETSPRAYDDIRKALERLNLFAIQEQILIRAMKHTKKPNGQVLPVVSMVYGSKAWTEVIRIFPILWPVNEKLRDTLGMGMDDPTNIVLLRGKNNYAPKSLPAKGYCIDAAHLKMDGQQYSNVTHVRFTRAYDITNDDMEEKLAETKKETTKRQGEENATDVWLREYLKTRGTVPRKQVIEAYEKSGLGSNRTLTNRAKSMGIFSEPMPGGTNNREVQWSLSFEM